MGKLDIFCHIPREDWFCDRYGKEYSDYSSHRVSHNDVNCDIVWLLASWCWRQLPESILKERKVVCTIHHEVPWKFNENRKREFLERDKLVDVYHVPCEQTRKFISKYTNKPMAVIGYWCNPNIWKYHDRDACKDEFGLSKNNFIVSSFQRDTEGSDLKTPKYEKGPDIFCMYVEKLRDIEKNVHVLLNGWRRQYVMGRLDEMNIPYTYIELPDIDTVARMYCATDLYIVGSRHEGGPQALLECALTKTPIVSTDVGMARDVLNDSSIFTMSEDFYPKIPTLLDVEIAFDKVQEFKIENHMRHYDGFFEEVFEL